MSRKKRFWSPDYFYHVTARGNRRDPLFRDKDDVQAFYHILGELYEQQPFEIAAYCIMTNHYHLQIRSPELPLSKLMFFINKRYASYFNAKYELTGHVYEKRFHDSIIVDDEGMQVVSWYIHLNPVEANMVRRPETYPWSSFHYYKNPESIPPPYLNTDRLLAFFEGTDDERREKYCNSMKCSKCKKGDRYHPKFVE